MQDREVKLLAKYSKDIRTENGLPQSLFDEIEALIRDYCSHTSIRHGEGVLINSLDGPTSWHFNNDFLEAEAHVTVCFKNGREWADDCYLDEVPAAFLLHVLEKIKKCRHFRDQRPVTVDDDAQRYIFARNADKERSTVLRYSSYLRRLGDDE